MTKKEMWQDIFHRYEASGMPIPVQTKNLVAWAIAQGLAAPGPATDPMDQMGEECSRALRDEWKTDRRGRRYRVNHAVRQKSGGSQVTLWADISTAPRSHMVNAFAQRRDQVVGDCYHLKTDVDCFNDTRPTEEPIQLELNFTKDVQEIEVMEQEDSNEPSSTVPRPQVEQLLNAEHP